MSKATVGLFVPLSAKPDQGQAVTDFLVSAKELVAAEPDTIQWYGVKFSDTQHAIFDTFAAPAGRDAHLSGKVAAALLANASTLLASAPVIAPIEILAALVRPESSTTPTPTTPTQQQPRIALSITLVAKPGKADAVRQFLVSALPLIEDEPETLQWFAYRASASEFGILCTAGGEGEGEGEGRGGRGRGRGAAAAAAADLEAGQVAAALRASAADLLVGPPHFRRGEVLAAKVVV